MTKQEYRRNREKVARKARAEYLDTVVTDGSTPESLSQTMRAINYIVRRMGRDSVIIDQLASIFLGHMLCFTRREVRTAERKWREFKAKQDAAKDDSPRSGRRFYAQGYQGKAK